MLRLLYSQTDLINCAIIFAHTPDIFTLMDHVISKLWNNSVYSTRRLLKFVPWMLALSFYNTYKLLVHWDILQYGPISINKLEHKVDFFKIHTCSSMKCISFPQSLHFTRRRGHSCFKCISILLNSTRWPHPGFLHSTVTY